MSKIQLGLFGLVWFGLVMKLGRRGHVMLARKLPEEVCGHEGC